ncbi:MAG: hypothetical protein JNM70_15625, partial [Anaerolineae bacterium]|nr:hypothetical protein [Anaerolineae bacterium]
MLQIVYHAPPTLSRHAARLLQRFHSTAVLPELQAIVLDEQIENWTRIYALRAIVAAPGDLLLDAFEPLARAAILQRERKVKQSRQQGIPINDWFEIDLFPNLIGLVEKHPSNRAWFFSILDAADPYIQKIFLESHLHTESPNSFHMLVVNRLLNLLDIYPQFLDPGVVQKLVGGGAEAESWLDTHFDAIVRLCLEAPESNSVKQAASEWPRLDKYLHQCLDQWEMTSDPPKEQAESRSEPAPAYL